MKNTYPLVISMTGDPSGAKGPLFREIENFISQKSFPILDVNHRIQTLSPKLNPSPYFSKDTQSGGEDFLILVLNRSLRRLQPHLNEENMDVKRILLGLCLSFAAYGQSTVYLGATYTSYDCSLLAGSQGYSYYQYGGWVNNLYIVNGCFGVIDSDTDSSGCDYTNLENATWSLRSDASDLAIWMRLSQQKDIYEPVQPYVENFKPLADELKEMVKDRDSCRLMGEFFLNNLRLRYEELEANFRQAHNQALDSRVGQAWQDLENEYRTVRSLLR